MARLRKSGRPLEAELAGIGYALLPAEPPRHLFADGAELTLPTDRGGQYTPPPVPTVARSPSAGSCLIARRGMANARGLGWKPSCDRRQLDRATRGSLFGRKATLAGIATSIDHPHLEALIRSVAYRSGSVPECTPAFAPSAPLPESHIRARQIQPRPDSSLEVADPQFSSKRWQRADDASAVHIGCSGHRRHDQKRPVVAVTSSATSESRCVVHPATRGKRSTLLRQPRPGTTRRG